MMSGPPLSLAAAPVLHATGGESVVAVGIVLVLLAVFVLATAFVFSHYQR